MKPEEEANESDSSRKCVPSPTCLDSVPFPFMKGSSDGYCANFCGGCRGCRASCGGFPRNATRFERAAYRAGRRRRTQRAFLLSGRRFSLLSGRCKRSGLRVILSAGLTTTACLSNRCIPGPTIAGRASHPPCCKKRKNFAARQGIPPCISGCTPTTKKCFALSCAPRLHGAESGRSAPPAPRRNAFAENHSRWARI